jgi:hypothetical protein
MPYSDREKQLKYLRDYKKERLIEIPKELKDDKRLKSQIKDLIQMALKNYQYHKEADSKPASLKEKPVKHTKQSKTKKPKTGKGL